MAHEVENAAFALKPAWHGLGTVLDRMITSKEALTLVPELNSEVIKVPVKYKGIELPDHFHTVRKLDDRPLGIVGRRYTVLQNQDALDLLDSLILGGDARYESVISLRNGAAVALVVNLKGLGVKVGGEDKVDAYGLLSNSHDGTSSVTFAITPVRVVCANTLAWALEGTKLQHRVRHSTNMAARMAEVHTILDITQDYMTEFERDATKLMHTPMNDSQWEEFLGKLIVVPDLKDLGKTKNGQPKTDRGRTLALNTHEKLTQRWVHLDQTAAQQYKGTRWGALQAISYYNQREATVQAKGSKPQHMSDYEWTDAQDRKRAERLFIRTMDSNNLTEQAHKLLAVG